MRSRRNWTREELVLAINLYCKIPFGQIHNRNPKIMTLAKIINRSPNAVSYKLANFAHIDPSLQRKGASHASKLDVEVWNEFYNDWENLIDESEQLLAKQNIDIDPLPSETNIFCLGEERMSLKKSRINQSFFRKSILAAYDNHCCVTGLSIKELLVASHIIPWAKDKKNRLNPRNGLCLNALHDRAFDTGLFTVRNNFTIKISSCIGDFANNSAEVIFFKRFENQKICLPKRFYPDPQFLGFHRSNIYIS